MKLLLMNTTRVMHIVKHRSEKYLDA